MKRWIWDLYQEIYVYKIYEYEMYIMKYDQKEYKSPIVTIVYPITILIAELDTMYMSQFVTEMKM